MSRSSDGSFTPASRRISVRCAEPGLPAMSFEGLQVVREGRNVQNAGGL